MTFSSSCSRGHDNGIYVLTMGRTVLVSEKRWSLQTVETLRIQTKDVCLVGLR